MSFKEKISQQDVHASDQIDKADIRVKLSANSGICIARSQARSSLLGLDKFRVIIMDYDKVPTVGQAFADEIYRVFRNKHPDITIINENMNEAVQFMIERAKTRAKEDK